MKQSESCGCVCLQEWIDALTGAPLCSRPGAQMLGVLNMIAERFFCLPTSVFVCHFSPLIAITMSLFFLFVCLFFIKWDR